MNSSLKILGVIPARAGSKGVPNKNIRLLGGKPLIWHSIQAALDSKVLCDVIVSSDSDEILNVAMKAGGIIPLLRPTDIAADNSPTIDAVLHAIEYYSKELKKDITHVLLLQPTSPLRVFQDIRNSIQLMEGRPDIDTLISCYDASHVHPSIMYSLRDGIGKRIWQNDESARRQQFEKVYVRNGAIYLAKKEHILKTKRIFGDDPLVYEMPRSRSINIDEELDLKLADLYLKIPSSD